MTLFAWGIFKSASRKVWITAGFVLLIVLTNPLLCNIVLKKYETPSITKDQLPLIETAVVLGGMVELGKDPPDQTHLNGNIERIEETISLYHEGFVQRIIFSGGSGSISSDEREGLILHDFILMRGVRERALIIEPESRNTYENAVETARILDSLNLLDQPVLLVTSAFHMPRAVLCFKKQGINVTAYPVDFKSSKYYWKPEQLIPSPTVLEIWKMLFREWVGMAVYKGTGYT
ncbi:MAG: YdcF family protein [Marinoscillum sp.]